MDTLVILIYLVSLSVTQFIHNVFCHSYRLDWLDLGYVTNTHIPNSTMLHCQVVYGFCRYQQIYFQW